MSDTTALDPAMEIDPITTSLVKANITEQVIAQLREKAELVSIQDHEDKEGYEAVKKTRLEIRKYRTTAEKICADGRADAIAIQKRWLEAEKKVTGQLKRLEESLKKKEDDFDNYHEQIRLAEEQRIQEERERAERAERDRVTAIMARLAKVGYPVSYEQAQHMTEDQVDLLEMEQGAILREREEEARRIREENERIREENERMKRVLEENERQRQVEEPQAEQPQPEPTTQAEPVEHPRTGKERAVDPVEDPQYSIVKEYSIAIFPLQDAEEDDDPAVREFVGKLVAVDEILRNITEIDVNAPAVDLKMQILRLKDIASRITEW